MIEIIVGVLGLVPIAAYLVHLAVYSPGAFFRVCGDPATGPIEITGEGCYPFGISTNSNGKVRIEEIKVKFDPEKIELKPTSDGKTQTSIDREFPLEIVFPVARETRKNFFQLYGFDYVVHSEHFRLRFEGVAQVAAEEVPPVLDLLPPRKIKFARLVDFAAPENFQPDPKKHGFFLSPGESSGADGDLAKKAVYAVADKEGATLRVIEGH